MTDPVYTPLPVKATLNEWSAEEFSLHIRDNLAVSPAGIVRAKGDLPVSSGANTMSRLPAGSNTQIIESDLAQAEKMKNSWAFVPVGGIILWSGALGSLPSNWQLCDGTNGTPNLQNRFVIGAGGAYNPGNTGGANSLNLQHNHSGSTTSSAGTHSHTQGATGAGTSHTHNIHTSTPSALTAPLKAADSSQHNSEIHYHGLTTGAEAAHTHTNPDVDSGGTAHTHSVTSGNQLSSSQDIRPPFYQLAYIMRLS